MTTSALSAAIRLVEQGLVPDAPVRMGMRHLLRQRLAELHHGDAEHSAAITREFIARLRGSPLALLPEKANEQHYELPAAFFSAVLGPHRKYSCCLWSDGVTTLEQAEAAALTVTCERAGLADGQDILELGCGWGSLSLWMAQKYPNSHILAVSNSHSQREFIEAEARSRDLRNLEVVTQDFNRFATQRRFDRVVSVEMFEHLRNWPNAFSRVAGWLNPDGRFFLHVFVHRDAPYAFEPRDDSDWMSRYFFSGGMMPSDDLALQCQDDLSLVERWRWDGRHYQRTSAAWLARMDTQRKELAPLFESVYGKDAALWWTRWRLFFLAVEELFGYRQGQQWWVSHYLFAPR